MMKAGVIVLLFILLSGYVYAQPELANRDELSDLNPSVITFNDFFACKRLLTKNGVFGCGSDNDDDGDFGALFPVSNAADFANAQALEGFQRSLLLEPEAFNDAALIADIAADENIAVILVADSNFTAFAPAEPSDINPSGTGILRELFTQPMALLSASETETVRLQIAQNAERGFDNNLWQHSVEMDFYNGRTDVDSEFCLSIDFCDPLGGQSVWGSVGESVTSGKQNTLFAIKIDSEALFHDLTFAASEVAASVTVMLSVADALSGSLSDIAALPRGILFGAFQGESFDAVGSKRFLFDIENSCIGNNFDAANDTCKDFPFLYFTEFNELELTDITEVISIENIGEYQGPVTDFFLHTQNADTLVTDLTTEVENVLPDSTTQVNVQDTPSATVSTLAAGIGGDIETVVLTGFQNDVSEVNSVFHTRFDRAPAVGEAQNSASTLTLIALSTAIARTLVTRAGDGTDVSAILANVAADPVVTREIEFCLTEDFSCSTVVDTLGFEAETIQQFFQTLAFVTNRAPDLPAPPVYFTSIYRPFLVQNRAAPKGLEFFIRNFLALRLSQDALAIVAAEDPDNSCNADLDCADLVVDDEGILSLGGFCNVTRKSSAVCVAGKCICSSVFYHDAVSPAVLVEEDGFGLDLENFTDELVFTEPVFELPTVELFQQSNSQTEAVLLAAGLVFLVASYLLVGCMISTLSNTKYKLL